MTEGGIEQTLMATGQRVRKAKGRPFFFCPQFRFFFKRMWEIILIEYQGGNWKFDHIQCSQNTINISQEVAAEFSTGTDSFVRSERSGQSTDCTNMLNNG